MKRDDVKQKNNRYFEYHIAFRILCILLVNTIILSILFILPIGKYQIRSIQSVDRLFSVIAIAIFIAFIGVYSIIKIYQNDKKRMFYLLGNTFTRIQYKEFIELNHEYIDKTNILSRDKEAFEEDSKQYTQLLDQSASISEELNQLDSYITLIKETSSELTNFYDLLSNQLSAFVWVTDYEGKILVMNQFLMDEVKRFDKKKNQTETVQIFDILSIQESQFELFRTRDFNHVMMHFQDGKALSGKSKRIFEDEKIKYIVFSSEISNEEKMLLNNYLKRSRDLHFISEISKLTTSQLSMESTLRDIADKIAFIGNFDTCSIRLAIKNNILELKALGGYTKDFVLNTQVEVNENFNESHMSYSFRENKILLLNSLSDLLFEDEIVRKILQKDRKVAYIPLSNYNRTIGILALISETEFDSEKLILLESISINVTIALEKLMLYEQLKSNYFQTVEAFITASELKTDKFNGHSRRVAEICRIIGEKLYLTQQEIDELYIAGLLHDIGKLAFSEDSTEYALDVDQHGLLGRQMVERVGLTQGILDGIEHHHLDYNLQNDQSSTMTEQPYYAQIIRVANDFDLYMSSMEEHTAIDRFVTEMHQSIGIKYSPQFVRIIDNLLSEKNLALTNLYSQEVINE